MTHDDHNFIHENIAAALTGALSPDERQRFDAHLHACPACFDAWTEAKDADRSLLRTLAPLQPSDHFESALIHNFRETTMRKWQRPVLKKAGFAIAAAVALAATGSFANFVLNQNFLPNPFRNALAQSNAPSFTEVLRDITSVAKNGRSARDMPPPIQSLQGADSPAEDEHAIIHSKVIYRGDELGWQNLGENEKANEQSAALAGAVEKDNEKESELGHWRRENIAAGNPVHPPADTPSARTLQEAEMKYQEIHDKTVAQIDGTDSPHALVKSGNGSLTLSGANSFNHSTTINNGPLDVNGRTVTVSGTITANRKDQLASNAESPHQADHSYFQIDGALSTDAGGNDFAFNTGGANKNKEVWDRAAQDQSPRKSFMGKSDPAAPNVTPPSMNLFDASRTDSDGVSAGQESVMGNTPSPNVAFNVPSRQTANTPVAATQPGASESATPSQQSAPAQSAIKVIRNGNVTFEVRSFDDASTIVSTIVTEEKGYVSSTSSEKLANGKVTGAIIVRVPPENLDRFLLKIRAMGDLKAQQIAASDVTKQYTDLESELRGLRTLEERLLNLIKTGKGEVKDLVEAEKQLGEYRIRIEKIEGEIRYYNNLVGMATLNITAYEKDIQKPTAAAELENVGVTIQTEDVETKYKTARDIITEAKGRIVDSELKQHDAGQLAATITADVPPEKSDFVSAQLKQLGTVASFARDRRQTTTGGTGTPAPTVEVEKKDTHFVIALYNLANIAPRETTTLTLAVPDVEAAYKQILAAVKANASVAPAPAPDDKKLNESPANPVGKIVASSLTGESANQLADIRADVRAELADAILQAIRAQGEVVSSSSSENTDNQNVTSTKRGIQLRIVSVASVNARETQSLRTVAANVPDSYNKLVAAIQTAEAAGNARLIASQLRQADLKNISASLAFDIKRTALASVDKALADAGIDYLARNISKSTDVANTLDTKVRIQIDELIPADNLEPRRSTGMVIEHENVESAIAALRSSLPVDARELDYSITKEPSGRVTAHIVLDTSLLSAPALKANIKSLGGAERGNQVVQNNQIAETKFAKERIDLTLTSAKPLLAEDKGIATTLRAALASAATALLTSLYLLIVGALFLGPFLIVALLAWKLLRRKKAVV